MRGARPVVIGDDGWTAVRSAGDRLDLAGRVTATNPGTDRPLVVTGVRVRVDLLSTAGVDGLAAAVAVRPADPARPARADGYQVARSLGPGGRTEGPTGCWAVAAEVVGPAATLDGVYAAHLSIALDTVGPPPSGPDTVVHHVVAATGCPPPDVGPDWRPAGDGLVVGPLRTHLLGPLDDPVDLVTRYALPHTRPGDVVALGESPLAVVQGRFVDPANSRPGWVASRLAQFMSGEGSVGTAPGLQAVVDQVGAPRVVAALAGGVAGKLVGRDGWFYRLAGRQSALVDDVTGTLPPYDKLIVAGPRRAGEVCRAIRAATGLEAVVVDANDLGAVDVIAASDGVDRRLVRRALRSNPAGNAAESTPLVLIRRA